MPTKSGVNYLNQTLFYGGIAPSNKLGVRGSFAFGKNLNIFDEPSQMTIMPKATKVSGNNVTGLVKWIVSGAPHDTNMYFYDENGVVYKETSGGTWSVLHTVPSSHGQGMAVFQNYLYCVADSDISRYGPLDSSPTWTDSWGSTQAASDSQTAMQSTATTKFGPAMVFTNGVAFGNGNYLVWWDNTLLETQKITLPPGLSIRSLAVVNQFLMMGTWRGTSITANEEGFVFTWDGASDTFNDFASIPQGGVAAMVNSKNRLIMSAGGSGQILMNYNPSLAIQTIPKLSISKYLEIYPGAITNWRGMTQIGLAANTNSSSIYGGVYTYGSSTQLYPEVLNYSFTISSGTQTGTTLSIGSLYGIGNSLYIGWNDNGTYGVDKITNSNDPYALAQFESLIFDAGQLYRDKLAKKIKAVHLPLLDGESVQLGYNINRATDYTYDSGAYNNTVGSTETKLIIPSGRFREIQFTCLLGTNTTTSPTVTYVGMEYDDLTNEEVY